ncbi:MAG TPA: hypothetical protein VGJ43_04600 [Acidimicrobiales bacterium]
MDAAAAARDMWTVGEPLHAVTYFAPDSQAAWAAAGLRGFWRGYFATRLSPLGEVPAGVATAVLYNFAPAMVARAVPEVWTMVTPAGAWAARVAGVDAALRAGPGDGLAAAGADLAGLARAAVDGCDPAGRLLFAAHTAMPWPDEPHLVLWQALTLLREFRGDGHNAALLAAGVDGCAAHVLASATGGTARAGLQPHRGWTDDEWDAAADGLAARGLVTGSGVATAAGHALKAAVEDATDRAAARPWRALGPERTRALHDGLAPIARAVVAAGMMPVPNPMGAPMP